MIVVWNNHYLLYLSFANTLRSHVDSAYIYVGTVERLHHRHTNCKSQYKDVPTSVRKLNLFLAYHTSTLADCPSVNQGTSADDKEPQQPTADHWNNAPAPQWMGPLAYYNQDMGGQFQTGLSYVLQQDIPAFTIIFC